MYPANSLWQVTPTMSPFRRGMFSFVPEFEELEDITFPLRGLCLNRQPYLPYPRGQRLAKRRGKKQWLQSLSLQGYHPDEIDIKAKGGMLTVHAKTKQKCRDGSVYVSETSRHFTLPENVDVEDIRCLFRENGRLTLKAPIKNAKRNALPFCNRALPLETKGFDNDNASKSKVPTDLDSDTKKFGYEEKENATMDTSVAENNSTVQEEKENKTTDDEIVRPQTPEVVKCENKISDNKNIDKTSIVEVEDIVDDSDTEIVEKDEDAEEIITTTDDECSETSSTVCHSPKYTRDNEEHKPSDVSMAVPESKTVTEQNTKPEEFQIRLAIPNVSPENVKLRCKDHTLYLDAVEERYEGDMYSRTEFHRQFKIPEGAISDQARAKMNEDGQLCISVPVADNRKTDSVKIPIEYQ